MSTFLCVRGRAREPTPISFRKYEHIFTSLNEANALLYKRDELIGNITRADDELGAKEDALKVRDRQHIHC